MFLLLFMEMSTCIEHGEAVRIVLPYMQSSWLQQLHGLRLWMKRSRVPVVDRGGGVEP